MPKENTKCSGNNCCTGLNGGVYEPGLDALNTYFRWTGGVKTDGGGLPSYSVGENTAYSNRCGGLNAGGATCYNDCCFTPVSYTHLTLPTILLV